MNPERLMALVSARGVNLEAISRGGNPEWTPEDVAIAASGLPRHQFYIALFSLAGDHTVWTSVKWWLMEQLLADRGANGWAATVENIHGAKVKFSEELVELFLLEETRPAAFQAAPQLRAIALHVEPETWGRVLSRQYACVHDHYHRALADADHFLRRKLRHSES